MNTTGTRTRFFNFHFWAFFHYQPAYSKLHHWVVPNGQHVGNNQVRRCLTTVLVREPVFKLDMAPCLSAWLEQIEQQLQYSILNRKLHEASCLHIPMLFSAYLQKRWQRKMILYTKRINAHIEIVTGSISNSTVQIKYSYSSLRFKLFCQR